MIDLEDAGTIVRDRKGKVRVKQSVPLTRMGAMSGAAWGGWIGALFGLLMLNPLLGFAAGVLNVMRAAGVVPTNTLGPPGSKP